MKIISILSVLTLPVVLILLCLSGGKNINKCDHLKSHIKEVGGCNRYGKCGAILEDDTVVEFAFMPVKGAYPRGASCRVVGKR